MRLRLARLILLVAVALPLPGCLVLSLHPFYDSGSIEFDDALLGQWENADDRSVVKIERGEWKSYRVSYPVQGGPVVFTGYLTRLGDARVIDLSPARSAEPESLLIPAHFVVRLQLLGDTLTVTGLDYGWFVRESEQGRLAKLRPGLDERKNVVLSAETSALRAWLSTQARGSSVFADEVRYVRKP